MSLDKASAKIIAEINETASQFNSTIVIRANSKSFDAKSMLGLAYSILSCKSFKLDIKGPDEAKAKMEMARVFWKHGLPVEVL